MTNVCDSCCNSYICIIWLGYIYPTLARDILFGCMLRCMDGHRASLLGCSLSSYYWSPPEQKTSCANPWLPVTWNPCIWKLGSKICREPRQKVLGTPPPVELHCKKGSLRLTELQPWRHISPGINVLGKRIPHQAWKAKKQFGTNSSHVFTHLLVVREGFGVLLVFAKVSHGFLTVNSNIRQGQFWQKEVFFETPCRTESQITDALSLQTLLAHHK